MGGPMTQLNVSAMQWSKLDYIDDVQPIGDQDAACLLEIRDVLAKHGKLDRFGVSLLHSHFQLDDDEMMLETTDISKREHWVRPVKKAALADMNLTAQTTVVSFSEDGYAQHCGCCMNKHGHSGAHCG